MLSNRKNVIFLLLAFLAVSSVFFIYERHELSFFSSGKHNEEEENEAEENKIPLQDRMDLAWQQEVELTKDPATGTVPRERLLAANNYARMLQAQQASNRAMGAIAGVNWVERGPKNVGGRTRAILVDPNDPTKKTVWAGSVGGGLWKTTDITAASPSWSPQDDLFPNLAVTTICANPANTQIMYFGTGEGYSNADAIRGFGIWKTTNGGLTWAQLPSTTGANYYYVNRMIVHPTGDVYAATNSGLFRSQDNGTTWVKVLGAGVGAATNNISDVEIAADNYIWASTRTNGEIYKSPSGNAGTWTKLNTGANGMPTTGSRLDFALAPSNAQVCYVFLANGGVDFYKTSDGGATWTLLTKPVDADGGIGNDITRTQYWYDMSIAVDPNNSNSVFVGGVDLFKTTNSGSTWQQVTHWYGGFGFQYVHADQHIALFEPGNSNVIYFGNDGGIWRSSNATAAIPSISFKAENYNVTQYYACAIHPTAYNNYFLAGAQDNGSQQYTSAGINATNQVTGGDGCFTHIDQNQPQYQFTSYVYNNFYRSTNGGTSFTGVSTTGGSFVNPSDYDNSSKIMYSYSSGGVYTRWINATTGNTFQTVNLSGGETGGITAISCSPNTTNRVFIGVSGGKVYRVDNANSVASGSAGVIINGGAGMPSGSISCIAVETGNDNHLLVTYSNYGINSVWETTNGGTNWTSVEGNLPDMPVRWALFNPNNNTQAMLATEVGVWTTDLLNGPATVWGPSNTGLANVSTYMLKLRSSDKMVIAATHGRGLFSSDVFADPFPDFIADKTITYTGKAIQFNDASLKSTGWEWDFGDASTSTLKNPIKSYANPGIYTVKLKINSNAGLTATKVSYIQILPNRGTPYTPAAGGNFDINPNDFGPDNFNGTPWQRGNSGIAAKSGTNSGSNAWVTGLAIATYADNSDVRLMTPNYNFSAAGTYTLKFFRKNSFEIGYDGLRVEYSFDKGDNWIPLGIVSANWYDFANSAAATAYPLNEPYFNVTKNVYTLCQYDVSFLAGNLNVAFRLRFKADNSVGAAGVAVDDFEIIAPLNNPLPVQLVSFTGKALHDKNKIEWITASELNNKGFILERNFNSSNFVEIGFVTGNGTSNAPHSYSFDDKDIADGTCFYRLKQVDFDGNIKVSVAIRIVRQQESLNITLFPNPADDILFIRNLNELSSTIKIYDSGGKVLFNKTVQNQTSLLINMIDLKISKGIYLVVVEDESRRFSQRFLKL